MIRSLSIESFRGIENLSIENPSLINVLVGKNNSSKSSVLEALAILMASKSGANVMADMLKRIILWRGWYGTRSIDDIFHKDRNIVSISAQLEDEFLTLTLRKGEEEFKGKILTYLTVRTEKEMALSKFKAIIDREKLIPKAGDEFTTLETFPPEYGFEFLIPSTLRQFGYVERLYSRAYEERVVKSSLKVLQTAYPDTRGFSPLIKDGVWVLHVETSEGVYPYYLMGEGFKSAVIISFLMPLLKNGHLFIDLAEAFHHPKSLRIMARTLIEGAKKYNVQVFLTTHSLELIELLGSCVMEKNVDGKLFHLRRNGKLGYTVSDLANFKSVIEDIKADLSD